MKINQMTRDDFLHLAIDGRDEFFSRILRPEVFVVKQFYDGKDILALRQKVFEWGQSSEPTWTPLVDDCPDYHRLHDDYPQAHVKAKMHTFYHHGWYDHNEELFAFFKDIFRLKNVLAGLDQDHYMANIPSNGQIARVNVHHYPLGGGYLAEHIDPVAGWAKIQTLVQASRYGEDFQEGGLYARAERDGEKYFVDPYTEPGDLMVLSPGIHHGVEPIDPSVDYDRHSNSGRWIVLPIIVSSDYPDPSVVKPTEVR